MISKSNEESQENTVTDKAATPHRTPVDADDQLTKPDKDIDQNDAGYGEVDTPATYTANVNNPELFATMLPQQKVHSIEDTGLYTEELDTPQSHTKLLLTTKPPVLPEITKNIVPLPDNATTKDAVSSIVSSDEDEGDTEAVNDRKQRHHHDYQHLKQEEQIAIFPEHQDEEQVQVIKTPTPTQLTTDDLCIGISSSKASLPPPHDYSSMGTVLWVHPQSPLVCITVLIQRYYGMQY